MGILETVSSAMSASGIPLFGFCGLEDAGEILPARSANRIPPGARSLIVCGFPYYTGEAKGRNLSLYCAIPDYHEVAGKLLQKACALLAGAYPAERFVPFVDASPIREVRAGVSAGLGVLGRNGQLITKAYGSLLFLGEIVTGLPLPRGGPGEECEGCGACLRACPTGALSETGFDRTLCRSWITQKKGELSVWEAEEVKKGGLAWGCDLCTLACPHNRAPKRTPIGAFLDDAVARADEQNLDALLLNRAFAYRGKKVILRNLQILSDHQYLK